MALRGYAWWAVGSRDLMVDPEARGRFQMTLGIERKGEEVRGDMSRESWSCEAKQELPVVLKNAAS